MDNLWPKSLEYFIKIYKDQDKLIEEDILTNYIGQICKELIELHKNKIIHKNLMPKNIFINANNKIKLGEPKNENIIGNINYINYMAPETEKNENSDNRADIYSLGCIIYELFSLKVFKENETKDCKINTEKYNEKWQELINLLLTEDYNKRPNIEEVYYKYIKKNEISLILKIDKIDINKQIFYLDNTKTHNHLNEIEILNGELYICDKENNNENNINNEKNIKKFFIPKKEGIYTIKIKFYDSITDCSYMFYDCSNINSIDLSSFDTEKVNNMSYMFKGCRNLENIDLTSFNTNNVENMSYMFSYCNKLNEIDLSSFNTKKVKNMSCMFNNCANLENINLSSFNTENVINMDYMFEYCTNIQNIDLSSFNIKNVKDMSFMFCDCINLNNLILPSLTQESNKFGIFTHCDNLKIEENNQEIIKKDNPYFESSNCISKI